MCIVFSRTKEGSLLVGANREEQNKRPFGPPEILDGVLIAGSDRGPKNDQDTVGTWLGINSQQMVVAVTNRHDGIRPRIKPKKSRGLLTVELLKYNDPEEAVAKCFWELHGGNYGPSNFFMANKECAYLAYSKGPHTSADHFKIDFGDHAVANLDMDDYNDPRVKFIRNHMTDEPFLDMAKNICSHDEIIRTDPDHTTRCSSIFMLGEESKFYHTMDSPDKSPYQDLSKLLPF